MKVIKSDEEKKYDFSPIQKTKQIPKEDFLKKINGTLQSLKDTIDRGIKENKNPDLVILETLSIIEKNLSENTKALLSGISKMNESIKDIKSSKQEKRVPLNIVATVERDNMGYASKYFIKEV